MSKKVFAIVLGIAMVLSLFACAAPGKESSTASTEASAETSSDAGTSTEAEGGYKIGFINAFSTAPYCAPLNAAAEEKAAELGVTLQLVDGKADNQLMLDQAKSFIEQNVDAIVLFPADMVGSVAIVKAIDESGIPLIICNSRVDASVENLTDTLVCADLAYEGKMIGELTAELNPNGGVCAIIEGAAGTDAQINRTKGFMEGIEGSGIEVRQQLQADWDRAKAMTIADDFITSIPDLTIIFAQDDSMALGAVEAVKAANKLDQIQVFGIGYMGDEVRESLKAGELKGTCTQSPRYEGATAVELAVKAINGEQLDAWYMTECIKVTAENCETVDHGYNP